MPSFARCISHEYRYLHLSVGARSGAAPSPPSLPHCWGSALSLGRATQQLPRFTGQLPHGETEAGLPRQGWERGPHTGVGGGPQSKVGFRVLVKWLMVKALGVVRDARTQSAV